MKISITEFVHKDLNNGTAFVLNEMESLGVHFRYKLDSVLKERNLSMRKLSAITGIRQSSISEMATGKKTTINKQHLLVLMYALRITNLFDIIEIHFPSEVVEQFERERKEWIETQEIPLSVKELHKKVAVENV